MGSGKGGLHFGVYAYAAGDGPFRYVWLGGPLRAGPGLRLARLPLPHDEHSRRLPRARLAWHRNDRRPAEGKSLSLLDEVCYNKGYNNSKILSNFFSKTTPIQHFK